MSLTTTFQQRLPLGADEKALADMAACSGEVVGVFLAFGGEEENTGRRYPE